MIDIEGLGLSEAPIEGIQEVFENWEEQNEFPPLPTPGKHSFLVTDIRDLKQGEDGVLTAVLDLEVKDGGTEDGKRVNFVRVSTRKSQFTERVGLVDLARSAGCYQVPSSNREWGLYLKGLVDTQTPVRNQGDWRAFCTACNSNMLMKLTQCDTDQAAQNTMDYMRKTEPDKARGIQKQVSKFATVANNYKQFPENGKGGRVEAVSCKNCQAEIRAQYNVTRWLKPTE